MIDAKESKDFEVRISNTMADRHGITIKGQRGNGCVKVTITALDGSEIDYSCELSELNAGVSRALAIARPQPTPRKMFGKDSKKG